MFVVYLIIETLSIIGFEQSVLVVFVQGNESNEVFGFGFEINLKQIASYI